MALKLAFWDFLGGPVDDKNLPTIAEDMEFNPWSKKILHALEQLSLNTTAEPLYQLRPKAARERKDRREKEEGEELAFVQMKLLDKIYDTKCRAT